MAAEDGADLVPFRRWPSLCDGRDYTFEEVPPGTLTESTAWKAWNREK